MSTICDLSPKNYYCCYDHRTFTATAVVGYHRTNTAMFYSVLAGLCGRCFLTSAAQSSDSHLNATSLDCVNAPQVSPVSHTARPPPRVRFPTRKRPHCRDSRHSLDTVLSLSVVACREQLAHFRTARTIWSQSCNIYIYK